jgi:LAO/AO transport system kinase
MTPNPLPPSEQALLDAIVGAPGPAQRRAVAKTITLLESTRADHRARADAC